MKELFDAKQQMINNCGSGLVVLLTGENEVQQTDHVQTAIDDDGNAVYEDKEVTRYEYDYLELRGVAQPVTEATVLEAVRKLVEGRINAYDTSDNVNQFYLKVGETSVPYWLSRETRANLSHSVTTWKNAGNETYKLDLREYGTSIDIDCDKLLDMLSQLENYAVACYNVTSSHLNEALELTDIEALLAYDYTTDYPSKLTFEA